MADWGTEPWGLTGWGGIAGVPPAANPPFIVERIPAANSANVSEDATVTVRFYDVDLNLDASTIVVTINGVVTYDGTAGFSPGYVGRATYSAGSVAVQVYKLDGWGYESLVTVTGYAADTTALSITDTWSWTTRANPICYTGLTPLRIETAMLTPLVTFLDIEPARRLFLDNALITDPLATRAISNRNNKAARVLYQIGFETELSTILNPFNIKSTKALQSIVCERQNIMLLDAALMQQANALKSGIQSLFNQRAVTEEYISGFLEYLDSTIPTYRVSLVANMVMLAKAKELNL
jgi:hypothetical protein